MKKKRGKISSTSLQETRGELTNRNGITLHRNSKLERQQNFPSELVDPRHAGTVALHKRFQLTDSLVIKERKTLTRFSRPLIFYVDQVAHRSHSIRDALTRHGKREWNDGKLDSAFRTPFIVPGVDLKWKKKYRNCNSTVRSRPCFKVNTVRARLCMKFNASSSILTGVCYVLQIPATKRL